MDKRYWQKFILAVVAAQTGLMLAGFALLLEWHKHSIGMGISHYKKINQVLKIIEAKDSSDREMLYQQWQYNQLPDIEATED